MRERSDQRSALRYRPIGDQSKEPPQVSTLRAHRKPPSPRTGPVVADVQTDEPEIHTDDLSEDEPTIFHPLPRYRRADKRASASLPPARTPARPIRTTTDPGKPRSRHRMHPLLAIGLGLAVAVLLYTLIWGCWLGLSRWGNTIRFQGHNPQDTLTATLGGQSTRMIAVNSGQQISVYIFLGNEKAQVLTEQLSKATWGPATDQVVPTFSLDHGRFTLKLTGDPQYGNFANPVLTETFTIWPSTAGGNYQIERTA